MYLYIHLIRQLPVATVLIYSPDQTVTCSYCTVCIHLTRKLPVANVLVIYSPVLDSIPDQSYLATVLIYIHLIRQLPVATVLTHSPDQTAIHLTRQLVATYVANVACTYVFT